MIRPIRRACRTLLIPALLCWTSACSDDSARLEDPAAQPAEAEVFKQPESWFVDRTREAGLGEFRHHNGMSGKRHYSEMMGSGVAFLDFDDDGDLDVYAVQGGPLSDHPDFGRGEPVKDHLYRNDLAPGGEPVFVDVTESSGIVADGYGMGVAVADVNNDRFVDIYVMNDGADQLWLNNGDGTFSDHTRAAGLTEVGWSVSAAFVDFDRDGFLDLFVVYYVDFSLERAKPCFSLTGMLDYCGPLTHPAVADRLYRNLGNGTFEDVGRDRGVVAPAAAGLGVTVLDFDDDGRLDLAVANDGKPNHLWHSQVDSEGRAFFENVAVTTGFSVNSAGQAEAGMGIVAGDTDGDGNEDLLLTHLALETHTLYSNDGMGGFLDRSQPSGIGAPSWDLTGFGVAFLDYDLDGDPDVAAVAGGVKVIQEQLDAGDEHPLKMRKQLLENVDGRFAEVESSRAGESFARLTVGRGMAVGDVDNDGDPDLLVSNNGGPLELLINRLFDSGQTAAAGKEVPSRWLGSRLLSPSGRDALGATVIRPQRLRVGTDGSYASARDPRLRLGLGDGDPPTEIHVRWVDGSEEVFDDLRLGAYNTLRQGSGRPSTEDKTPNGNEGLP